MKKILSFFVLLTLSFGSVFAVSVDPSKNKNITKNLLLARFDLVQSMTDGKTYALAIDSYFETYKNDAEKIQDTIEKMVEAEKKLWNSLADRQTLLLVKYIQYRGSYALLSVSEEKPEEPETYSNSGAIASIWDLSDTIKNNYLSSKTQFQSIVGETLQIKNKENEEWIMGYPNYSELGIKKSEYLDAYGHEFVIVTLAQADTLYYQILGYTEKSETEKTALIRGNYSPKDSTYPISLFINPDTSTPIENGDTLLVK